MDKSDILIIDGRHLMWRVTDTFRQLSIELEEGGSIATGGMYGFLSVANKTHNKYGGKVQVAWEGKGNFRYNLYKDYKKKAERTDDAKLMISEMDEQELRLKAILRAMGVEQYLAVGCEADDVIGTLASNAKANGQSVTIYSGDSDMRQLVCDKIRCASNGHKGKDIVYDSAKSVEDRHGVPPCHIADMKALAGDSSDNIPGLSGIGPKRAAQLINEFGDIEGIIKAANDGKMESNAAYARYKEQVVEWQDKLRLFKRLTTILEDADMNFIEPKRNQRLVFRYFQCFSFVSLLLQPEFGQLMSWDRP